MGEIADELVDRMAFPFDRRRKRRAVAPKVTCRNCLTPGLYLGRDAHGCRALFNHDGTLHVCDARTVHGIIADDFEVL